MGVFHAGDRIYINLSCSCLEALKSNRFCTGAGLRNDPRHHGNLSLNVSAWLKSAPRYLLNFLAVYWFWANPITTTLDSEKIFWAKLSLSDAFCVKGGTTLVQPIIITRYKMQENHREPTKDLQSKELTTAISPLFCASSSAIPNQLETPCHFWPIAHPKRKSYPPFSFPRDCQCIAVEICNSPESSTLVF